MVAVREISSILISTTRCTIPKTYPSLGSSFVLLFLALAKLHQYFCFPGIALAFFDIHAPTPTLPLYTKPLFSLFHALSLEVSTHSVSLEFTANYGSNLVCSSIYTLDS